MLTPYASCDSHLNGENALLVFTPEWIKNGDILDWTGLREAANGAGYVWWGWGVPSHWGIFCEWVVPFPTKFFDILSRNWLFLCTAGRFLTWPIIVI